jgi:hypothetical protein
MKILNEQTKRYSKIDNQIRQTSSGELQNTKNEQNEIWQMPSAKFKKFVLRWSHYLVLMRIENPNERSFYEIEANSTSKK